jgi:hypothetical protein
MMGYRCFSSQRRTTRKGQSGKVMLMRKEASLQCAEEVGLGREEGPEERVNEQKVDQVPGAE